jgi:hypothetical protein
MRLAGSEPIGLASRPRAASWLAELTVALRDFGRRRRTPITVVGSLATAAILAFLLAGRHDEFAAALSGAAAWVLAATVLLQIVASRNARTPSPSALAARFRAPRRAPQLRLPGEIARCNHPLEPRPTRGGQDVPRLVDAPGDAARGTLR